MSFNSQNLEGAEGSDINCMLSEQLRAMGSNSLTLRILSVKLGTPVMLMHNLDPNAGLCNSACMVVTGLTANCIVYKVLGGSNEPCFIPRIILSADNASLGLNFTRKQFPSRLCFAMTVNKSQGQSFVVFSIDLRTPVFSHGQLYVAVAYTSSVNRLTILLPTDCNGLLKNIM